MNRLTRSVLLILTAATFARADELRGTVTDSRASTTRPKLALKSLEQSLDQQMQQSDQASTAEKM